MSTQQSSLPDPQTAYSHLYEAAHGLAFFGRLQGHGFVPHTEKEAEDLLELAGSLRQAETQEKTASANHESRFGHALNALNGVLKEAGYTPHDEQLAIKQAAAHYANDPHIYNSVLALKAYEAEMLTQQLAAQN